MAASGVRSVPEQGRPEPVAAGVHPARRPDHPCNRDSCRPAQTGGGLPGKILTGLWRKNMYSLRNSHGTCKDK